MKIIPRFNIFNKQEFGGNWRSIQECLQYAALYMHTWNLLEWVMANIIAAGDSANDNRSVEEIWIDDLSVKCKGIKEIYEHQNENPNRDAILALVDRIIRKEDSCRDLRDTIAHSHIYWVVAMGAYQQQSGWLRLRRNENRELKKTKLKLEKDEDATEDWRSALSNSSNPNITEDEINTPIYTAYGKSEITSELGKLMDYFQLFDYDPLSDLVVDYCYKTFGLMSNTGVN